MIESDKKTDGVELPEETAKPIKKAKSKPKKSKVAKKSDTKADKAAAKSAETETPKKLTVMQLLFVSYYLQTRKGAESARLAGYSEKSARAQAFQMLRLPEIKKMIADGVNRLMRRSEVDADYLMRGLRRNAERCMQATPVMRFDPIERRMVQVIDEDTGEGVWSFDSSGANRAFELLGKHVGFFEAERDPDPRPVTIVVHAPSPPKKKTTSKK